MYAIDVRNIVKKFGEFTAVKGISFTVDAVSYTHLTLPTTPYV